MYNVGYEKLKAAVIKDCNEGNGCFNEKGCNATGTIKCTHKYCNKFRWVIERAKHYGEKLGLNWEDVLNSWEVDRSYWYMNYYQDCNQPLIEAGSVRVFETIDDLKKSIEDKGFRCPSCARVTKNAYECDKCDWKVYGFLRDLGKGAFFYVKSELKGQTIFMPIAWEKDK